MRLPLLILIFTCFLAGLMTPPAASAQSLVVYAGRSKELVAPLIDRFQESTGVRVDVRYGNTPQLALAIRQEGRRSPADVFWAQDSVAVEALAARGVLRPLRSAALDRVLPGFADPEGRWVATSGRSRVLAYSTTRVQADQLPGSIAELTDSRFRGRVGWAPANASFQAFVTAMRSRLGDEETKDWLRAMKANGTKTYPKNSPILDAIAAGEIDLGLVNHYYLLGLRAENPDIPIEQTFFGDGDLGNLLFTSAAGILQSSRRPEEAERLLQFLLSDEAQEFFTAQVHEYPVVRRDKAVEDGLDAAQLQEKSPDIPPGGLEDLDGTLKLLRELDLL